MAGLPDLRPLPPGTRLTGQRRKDVADQLAEHYRKRYLSMSDLAEQVGLAKTTVRSLLLEAGVTIRTLGRTPDHSQDRKILDEARTGGTPKEIAERLDLEPHLVRLRMIELGIHTVATKDATPEPGGQTWRRRLRIVPSDTQLEAWRDRQAARHADGLPPLAPPGDPKKLSPCQRRQLAEDAAAHYRAGKSSYAIAAELGWSYSSSRNLLLLGGAPMRPAGWAVGGGRGGPATPGTHTIAGQAAAAGGEPAPSSRDS